MGQPYPVAMVAQFTHSSNKEFSVPTVCPAGCWRHSEDCDLIPAPQGLNRVLVANPGKAIHSCLLRAALGDIIKEGEP